MKMQVSKLWVYFSSSSIENCHQDICVTVNVNEFSIFPPFGYSNDLSPGCHLVNLLNRMGKILFIY